MSDILIRGIEMPGLDGEELRILIQVDGTARIDRWTYWESIEVFELPAHGDLISRDATIDAILDEPDEESYPCVFAQIVEEQLVIVPASK